MRALIAIPLLLLCAGCNTSTPMPTDGTADTQSDVPDREAFGPLLDELNSRHPSEHYSHFAHFDADGYVKGLGLRDFKLTQADIELIARCRKATLLAFSNTNVGELNLDPLKTLTSLKRFYVEDTSVTSEDLRFLASTHSLEWIGLDNTNVDDRVFDYIGDNPNLEHLGISGTEVDLPLARILELYPKLNHLVVTKGAYTAQEIEAATRARPGLGGLVWPD